MAFAYFGQDPNTCLDLIREEFGNKVADTRNNAFHDMSYASISQETLEDLGQAMQSGPLGRQHRPKSVGPLRPPTSLSIRPRQRKAVKNPRHRQRITLSSRGDAVRHPAMTG